MSNQENDFVRSVGDIIKSHGYKGHGEGIFTRSLDAQSIDWVSINGNSYFYKVDVGIVFPKINKEMRKIMPRVGGAIPFGDIGQLVLPIFSAPLQNYVRPPQAINNPPDRRLTDDDAKQLADVIYGALPDALAPFHSLGAAVKEAERVMEHGGSVMALFLVPLSKFQLGNAREAQDFYKRTLPHLKSVSIKSLYQLYMRNLCKSYGVEIEAESAP